MMEKSLIKTRKWIDMYTVDQIFDILHGEHQFFSVTFARRTTRKDGSAKAGDLRTLLCRTGVSKYVKGVLPPGQRYNEDFKCCVLTVWAMDVFCSLRRQGLDKDAAAWRSWRRIDLTSIVKLSVLPDSDLPPDIYAGVHEITNEYRLANMPKEPIPV